MKKSDFWKNELKFFIVSHPDFKKTDEQVFTPKKGLKIRFWIEGNLQIDGIYKFLHINYNSNTCLILSLKDSKSSQSNIFRIPWEKIITFELVTNEDNTDELKKLMQINPNQKN